MTKLIPFGQKFIAGNSVRTVSARDLHRFLGVGREFSNWIKGRIDQYGFAEKTDYLKVYAKTGVNYGPGRKAVNYHLTLDMAKELAMVERTDKGREARRYFIECEKELLERKSSALPAPTQPQQIAVDLSSVIPTRLLVTVERGEIVSTRDVGNCTVVDTDHLRALEQNANRFAEQLRAVLGDGSQAAVYKQLVEVR